MTGVQQSVSGAGRPVLVATDSGMALLGIGTTLLPGVQVQATAGPITASVVNPIAGRAYVFKWSHRSGEAATIEAPNSATTRFFRTATSGLTLLQVVERVGIFRVTVTDPMTMRTGFVDVVVTTRHLMVV